MKRASVCGALLVVALSHAVVRADVTITMTNTVDGPMAGFVGANAPSITMRVRGLKTRTDIDVMGRTVATVMDVAGKQVFMLDQTEKTVRRLSLASIGQPGSAAVGGINFVMPKTEVTAERTGRTEQVAGESCEEFHIEMTMDMSQVNGPLSTPEARDAMKDMRMVMKGSTWIARSSPGASEFVKFQEAAKAAGMALPADLFGGRLDPMAQAIGGAAGLPCLSELDMNYEGSSPMVEMLQKMGAMKVTSRLREVSLAPIEAEMFDVPAGYKETSIQNPLR